MPSLLGTRFNNGEGIVCEDQIRPVPIAVTVEFVPKDAAMILLPSAETHAAIHQQTGTLFEIHVWPKFVEV